jgi:hypothetical protein
VGAQLAASLEGPGSMVSVGWSPVFERNCLFVSVSSVKFRTQMPPKYFFLSIERCIIWKDNIGDFQSNFIFFNKGVAL